MRKHFALILSLITLTACATISPFSEQAYQQATSLKVDALALIDKASDPYPSHKSDVDTLILNIDKAYEYAKGRPKNEESTKQWAIIENPNGHSLGGFLKRWQDKNTIDAEEIEDAKNLVSDGFDTVIGLESGKIKN